MAPGWLHEIAVDSYRPNADRSITVVAEISVFAADGNIYRICRTIKLPAVED